METGLFPCCPIALLTCKNHAPFCPAGEGKIPRFDPFKGIDGANEILFFIILKLQNDNELQCFLSRCESEVLSTLSPPFFLPFFPSTQRSEKF